MREKLKLHCTVISGYAFKSGDLQNDESIPVIKIGNISNGENVIIDAGTQYVSKKFLDLDVKYQVHKGDVLISLTGSHLNQPNSMVGRVCRSYESRMFLLNQRAGKVICHAGTDPNYIFYLLSTKAVRESIVSRAYGAANQVNVSPSDIMDIKFEFHEYSDQLKISSILSAYDSKIDINNRKIRVLEQIAENIYKDWFVYFRFPGHEGSEYVSGNPRGWVLKNEVGVRWPRNWHYGSFSELGTFVRGKNITAAEMKAGNVPVISAGVEPSGFHNESNVKEKSLTISASGANAGFLKYHLNDIWAADCSYYQHKDNLWFAYNSLKFLQPVISNLQCGAAQPHVHPSQINRLSMIIPPSDIIQKYCKIVSPMYETIKDLKNANRNLVYQRNLLLPRLMSGKLEVQ